MRILARRNRVLWVNSLGMRRPTDSRRDLQRIVAKLGRSLGGCVEVEPNLFVTNPLVVPLPGIALVERLNASILAASLRRLCRRYGLERPILWTFLPYVNRLVGRLQERMVIYHCVDEQSAFSGVPRDAVIQMELCDIHTVGDEVCVRTPLGQPEHTLRLPRCGCRTLLASAR